MKVKNIALLAAAVMLIAVTGIGNAFAYSWSGEDYSILTGSNSITRASTVSNSPTVTYGGSIYWSNSFNDDWWGTYFYPTIFASDTLGNWNKYASPNGLDYNLKTPVAPSGGMGIPIAYATGTIPVTVQHRYGYSPDSNTYSTSFPQSYHE